jgi:hypothetical protein
MGRETFYSDRVRCMDKYILDKAVKMVSSNCYVPPILFTLIRIFTLITYLYMFLFFWYETVGN